MLMMVWNTRRRSIALVVGLVLLGTTVAAVLAVREPAERIVRFPGNCPSAFQLSDEASAGKHVITVTGVTEIHTTSSLTYVVTASATGAELSRGPVGEAGVTGSHVNYQPRDEASGRLTDGDVFEVNYGEPVIFAIMGSDGTELASSGVCQ